ncbi:MAG TPA: hypothetical protein VIJ04_00310 [Xanthobacteraceae bacterium]
MTHFSHYLRNFAAVHAQKTWGSCFIQPVVNKIRRFLRTRTEPNQMILVLQWGRIMVSTKAVAQPTKEDTYG